MNDNLHRDAQYNEDTQYDDPTHPRTCPSASQRSWSRFAAARCYWGISVWCERAWCRCSAGWRYGLPVLDAACEEGTGWRSRTVQGDHE